jgi:hypothetical protein
MYFYSGFSLVMDLVLRPKHVAVIKKKGIYVPVKLCREKKGKVHPTTSHEGPEGKKMYRSTLSSALDGMGGQR